MNLHFIIIQLGVQVNTPTPIEKKPYQTNLMSGRVGVCLVYIKDACDKAQQPTIWYAHVGEKPLFKQLACITYSSKVVKYRQGLELRKYCQKVSHPACHYNLVDTVLSLLIVMYRYKKMKQTPLFLVQVEKLVERNRPLVVMERYQINDIPAQA